jgi:hypothetical protein
MIEFGPRSQNACETTTVSNPISRRNRELESRIFRGCVAAIVYVTV